MPQLCRVGACPPPIPLIDSYNHTGYSQVLEEKRGTGPESQVTTFTIGDDVITQYEASAGAEYLLYDGQGSTRQLVDSSGSVVDAFSYDAYGVMLGGNPGSPSNPSDPSTHLLYTGEHFDTDVQSPPAT